MITPHSLRTARGWNELLAARRRERILGVQTFTRGGWSHPWRIRSTWNTKDSHWQASVHPGFVNGLDVTASITGPEGKAADVPLTDQPLIPLTTWRRLGMGADPTGYLTSDSGAITFTFEPVPDFFLALGVRSATPITADLDGLLAAAQQQEAPLPARRLVAMDLVLYHDRPGLAVAPITGIGLDATVLNIGVTTRQHPGSRSAAYLRATRQYAADPLPDALQQLRGLWQDTDRDSLLIGTVYLLSPEDTAEDAPPDETWSPYARHECFWNLLYAHNRQGRQLNADPLVLNTGLAAGLLDTIGNQILSTINDQVSAAAAFLSNQKIEGRFWSV